MSTASPGPLLSQPSPPWRVSGSNIADASGRVGASYYAESAGGAVVRTLVTPAANVAGIVLRGYSAYPNSGGISIYADTSAPSSAGDTTKRPVVFNVNWRTAEMYWAARVDIEIPAGLGLYLAFGGTGSASVDWDLR